MRQPQKQKPRHLARQDAQAAANNETGWPKNAATYNGAITQYNRQRTTYNAGA